MRAFKLYRAFVVLCLCVVISIAFLRSRTPSPSPPCRSLDLCDTDMDENMNLSEIMERDITMTEDELRLAFVEHKLPPLTKSNTYRGLVPDYVKINRRNPHLQHVSCPALFSGNQTETRKARQYMKQTTHTYLSNDDIIKLTSSAESCAAMRHQRGYLEKPLSEEEYDFPIAFSILLYKDVFQVERLLRSVYQPQNWYCLHIDLRTPASTRLAARSLANCFPNVIIADHLHSVHWGHISIIQAEVSCIKSLLHKPRWKYFINLSAQMFPLQTNRNLVKILTMFDGANDVEGTYDRATVWWMRARYSLSWSLMEAIDIMLPTGQWKTPAPYGIVVYKGSNQVAITREFAAYFVHSPVARNISQWFVDTLAPDENVWPTLNHNPHLRVPGSFTGDPETKKSTVRASIWLPIARQESWSWDSWQCQGKWVRQICIFGLGDLPWFEHRPELFVNKFHHDFEWLAYDCLEELIFNRTVAADKAPLNVSYYKELSFVKHKDQVVRLH